MSMAKQTALPPAPPHPSTIAQDGEGSKSKDEIVNICRQIWANKDKPEQLRYYIIMMHNQLAVLDEEQKVV